MHPEDGGVTRFLARRRFDRGGELRDRDRVIITEPVKHAALFPEADLPDPPTGHPARRIHLPGLIIVLLPGMSQLMVNVESIPEDRTEEVVAEVRGLVVAEGIPRAAWVVAENATPVGLVDKLIALGMTPNTEPPFEPRVAAMATVAPPDAPPSEIVAKPARTFAQFRAGRLAAAEAFEMSQADREALEAHLKQLWTLREEAGSVRTFIATIDDLVVGSAGAIFGTHALYLIGGSTLAGWRGRGAYRALVRARWEAAVAHGTPALTVSAGSMSRPVLERLGFETVGWADVLMDEPTR